MRRPAVFTRPLPLPLSAVRPAGMLADRVRRNYERLERDDYRPDIVLKEPDYPWPGDMEGRLVLALVLLEQATGCPARNLPELLDRLPAGFNAAGYLGHVAAPDSHDEQQLSGHSWLLRALCEHYEAHRDDRALSWIGSIVEGLALPAKEAYAAYPHEAYADLLEGGAIGRIGRDALGPWKLSTDIGCAFILLDGLTHVYSLTQDPRVGAMLDVMVEGFLGIDVVRMSLQTHATLSALRGLLRLAEIRRSDELVGEAQRIWRIYWTQARTANDANFNWFGRPRWTEPCAIVDSYIVAMSLWRLTRDPEYLHQAHRIEYNGLGFAQRPNGGYGCDCCAGAGDLYLAPHHSIYEAWWCCTMRAGEGLTRIVQDGWHTLDDALYLPNYASGTAHVRSDRGFASLEQRTDYPVGGEVVLSVAEAEGAAFSSVALVVPEGAAVEAVRVDGVSREATVRDGFVHIGLRPRAGMRIEVQFALYAGPEPYDGATAGGPCVCLRHGPLLLGASVPVGTEGGTDAGRHLSLPSSPRLDRLGAARYRIGGYSWEVGPVFDHFMLDPDRAALDRRQVVFPVV